MKIKRIVCLAALMGPAACAKGGTLREFGSGDR